MARLAVIVLVIALSFVLAGCSGKGADKPQVVTTGNAAPSDADTLYAEGITLEKHAGPIGSLNVLKDEAMLRMALDKYNQIISKYPTSDKIDDAAFRMGGIYEYLKDYTNAVKNYQRTYQWNPDTTTVARFKAAYLLDTQLGRRAEALQIYQEALSKITKSNEHILWVQYAEQRVKELSGAVKPQE
ncbi:MAG: tetratricopeptide repeat protein [Sedimentisphaerales bacterium]|jgi:tetratricopeptide (TPR) repeat protein